MGDEKFDLCLAVQCEYFDTDSDIVTKAYEGLSRMEYTHIVVDRYSLDQFDGDDGHVAILTRENI